MDKNLEEFRKLADLMDKHPCIRYNFNFAHKKLVIWKESKKGTIIKTETFIMTDDELKKIVKNEDLSAVLDKYYKKFKGIKEKKNGSQS